MPAYLFDLDGVLRRWDPTGLADIEARHGLSEGQLSGLAYAAQRYGPAVVGQVSDEQWRADVAGALAVACGSADTAIECVADWGSRLGRVDPESLAAVEELRAAGHPVALVVNATTRLELELVVLGLDDAFDAVVSSARTGIAKPDAAIYEMAAGLLGVPVTDCVYVGAQAEDVAGAERVGMTGVLHEGTAGLRDRLADAGD